MHYKSFIIILGIFCLPLIGMYACTPDKDKAEFHVDQNWIEVHFLKNMSSEQLVNIRDRLAALGIEIKYRIIQRDHSKNITKLQIEVFDGKTKLARATTEFLDEIPFGIRIQRNVDSDEAFKVGPLYTKRPK
jgi:hypothetical protein